MPLLIGAASAALRGNVKPRMLARGPAGQCPEWFMLPPLIFCQLSINLSASGTQRQYSTDFQLHRSAYASSISRCILSTEKR